MIHYYKTQIDSDLLPDKFTNPFDCQPHPLCVTAAEEVMSYLSTRTEWADELEAGKMFGTLTVQDRYGKIGYLSAFSGNLAHGNKHAFFVLPIYDLLQPDGFFVKEESNITEINRQIEKSINSQEYSDLKQRISELNKCFSEKIACAKDDYRRSGEERDKLRLSHPDPFQVAEMIRESQFQKAEIKRLKQRFKSESDTLKQELAQFDEAIELLKNERRERSLILQKRLFDNFLIINAKGEQKGLREIFEDATGALPPAGAGECAAPKMLQYAFLNHLKPIAMAEFWYGKSPKNEIRRHGYFYPACKSKCEPILRFMLQDVEIEDINASYDSENFTLETVYEDDWLLVINKPAGMLCVPGKIGRKSVYSTVRERYPEATGALLVHRLDMDTSGLILIAKTGEVHKTLQKAFSTREIKKTYIAILDGIIPDKEGVINLPLILDSTDRPRQIVSDTFGKEAITKYKVLKVVDNRTYIEFSPITGRTHQLRVHAAHPDGLNTPILGDKLYGKPADRLYLHAQSLQFRHPVTGELLRLEIEPSKWSFSM